VEASGICAGQCALAVPLHRPDGGKKADVNFISRKNSELSCQLKSDENFFESFRPIGLVQGSPKKGSAAGRRRAFGLRWGGPGR